MLQLIAAETLLPGYDSLISTARAQLLDSEISTDELYLASKSNHVAAMEVKRSAPRRFKTGTGR